MSQVMAGSSEDSGTHGGVLDGARAGEEQAFRELYRLVSPGLARYVSVLVTDDAEDVCAEAWLQACRDLAKFRGDLHDFRGWIARIARNRAIDLRRAQKRRPSTSLDGLEPIPLATTRSAEDEVLESMTTDDAIRLIAALPRDQAEAVMLRAVMGLDAATAAKVLGKRAGAVRTAAYRGLRNLHARVDDTEVDKPHAE